MRNETDSKWNKIVMRDERKQRRDHEKEFANLISKFLIKLKYIVFPPAGWSLVLVHSPDGVSYFLPV